MITSVTLQLTLNAESFPAFPRYLLRKFSLRETTCGTGLSAIRFVQGAHTLQREFKIAELLEVSKLHSENKFKGANKINSSRNNGQKNIRD